MRVYATVQRVPRYVVPGAGDNEGARPQYTTRNVVAYPPDPDTAVRVVCLLPTDLVQDLYLQFEGYDDAAIAREPAVQISLVRLRAAMWWLATHNWQWMEATRDQDCQGRTDSLGRFLRVFHRCCFVTQVCPVRAVVTI